MLYKELKDSVKTLGFMTIEDFAKYIGVTSDDVLEWESKDEIPYTVSLIVHLLKGDKAVPNNVLDNLVEECLPLASLLEEASSFLTSSKRCFYCKKS